MVEAHESTRQRLELSLRKDHEHHIAGKGYNSMTHYNLVHKFLQSSSGQGVEEARAWQLDKVESKKKVNLEPQRDKKKVHFASLMVICHFKKCGVRTKISEV